MLLHRVIYHDLKDRIASGDLKSGEKLAKQNTIAESFQTSRVTVQKAINLLKAEDLVYTVKGQGTFVSENVEHSHLLDSNIDEYFGFTTNYKNQEIIINEIISFHERLPDELEMKKLEISKNEVVYDIIRLRATNEEPLRLEYTIMPKSIIPGITNEVLEHSIYHHIRDNLSLKIGDVIRRVSADKADAYDQKYLNCAVDDPVLEVEQQVFLEDGRLFEFSQTRHRYDKGSLLYTNIS